MAKKRMMDSSLVESVLGKNHSMIIDEDWYEHTIIDHLVDSMGYEHLFGPDVRRSSENYQDVFIPDVLPEALSNVNQGLPAKAIDEAILKIKNIEGGSLEQRNEIFNDYLQLNICSFQGHCYCRRRPIALFDDYCGSRPPLLRIKATGC